MKINSFSELLRLNQVYSVISHLGYFVFDITRNWKFYTFSMFSVYFWIENPAQYLSKPMRQTPKIKRIVSNLNIVKNNLHFLMTFPLVSTYLFFFSRDLFYFLSYFSRRIVFSYTTLIRWWNCTQYPIRKQECTVILFRRVSHAIKEMVTLFIFLIHYLKYVFLISHFKIRVPLRLDLRRLVYIIC